MSSYAKIFMDKDHLIASHLSRLQNSTSELFLTKHDLTESPFLIGERFHAFVNEKDNKNKRPLIIYNMNFLHA